MPSIDFKHMFNFPRLGYNPIICCVIRVALNFHQAYIFGDVSRDSLVCLNHVDQGDGNMNKIILYEQPCRTPLLILILFVFAHLP